MPFADAFQSYNHYQNTSFKQSPAQRDASSRNDEIHAAARRERDIAKAKAKRKDNASGSGNGAQGAESAGEYGERALEWRHDLGAATTTESGESKSEQDDKPLPDFEMDGRGNVYLKSSGGGTRWWKKAKGACRGKSEPADRDVVR